MLATTGLYGLLAYTTLKRVREIGIRLAVGARPAQIRMLVLSHALKLLLIGSVCGLVAAVAMSRALQSVLFEVRGIVREFIWASARFSSPRRFSLHGFRPAARHASIRLSLCEQNNMNDLKTRFSPASQIARVHSGCGSDSCARYWCKYCDLLRRRRRPLATVAVSECGRLVRIYEALDENGARSGTLNLSDRTAARFREFGRDIFRRCCRWNRRRLGR